MLKMNYVLETVIHKKAVIWNVDRKDRKKNVEVKEGRAWSERIVYNITAVFFSS
jgi:hypothetical protein